MFKAFIAAGGLALSIAASTLAADPIERQVTVEGAAGATLAGTLTLPDGGEGMRYPALVLVAGSGPTNRDGNQPPLLVTDLLKQIARSLADQGIASLRYDKRGMHANAAGLPEDKAQWGDFFCWENFVGDVAAACEFLRKTPEVIPERVGVLGHSEGSMLALEAAHVLGPQRAPVALVLLSAPGRTADKYIVEQLARILEKQKATPEQTKYFLDQNGRITKAILETGAVPEDVPPGLAALYPSYLGRFLKSDLSCDPSALAAEFRGPVLAIAGARDVQISPERDAKALDAALGKRTSDDHELLIVPDASHNLKPVKDDDAPGFAGNVVPGVLEKISRWSAEKLARQQGE